MYLLYSVNVYIFNVVIEIKSYSSILSSVGWHSRISSSQEPSSLLFFAHSLTILHPFHTLGMLLYYSILDAVSLVSALKIIHVNPPSFVRSLRHFGIAENLRPGDENLRHLTVTSIFDIFKTNA